MTLKPLSDYILELNEKRKNDLISVFDFAHLVIKYTEFLKQPLTLGMFVPLDRDGVVLEPLQFCCAGSDCGCMGMPVNVSSQQEIDDYYEAKEKVLFEGWTHEDRYGWVQHHKLGLEINTETGTLAIFH